MASRKFLGVDFFPEFILCFLEGLSLYYEYMHAVIFYCLIEVSDSEDMCGPTVIHKMIQGL